MHHKVVGMVIEPHELQPVMLAPLLVGLQRGHVFQVDTLIHLWNEMERRGHCSGIEPTRDMFECERAEEK